MSNLDHYMEKISEATGARRVMARANSITGGSTLLGSKSLADYAKQEESKIKLGIGTLAGGVAGGILGWKQERPVLGVFAGASVLTNTLPALRASTRKEALWNMAQTGGGVLLGWAGPTPTSRALRFALGYVLVGAARVYYGDEQ